MHKLFLNYNGLFITSQNILSPNINAHNTLQIESQFQLTTYLQSWQTPLWSGFHCGKVLIGVRLPVQLGTTAQRQNSILDKENVQ